MITTANEMANEFEILYDKITNFDAPGYLDNEISTFLNKAQDRIVVSYYLPLGNKYRDGFEETEKRRKDLSELIRDTGNLTPSASSSSNLENGVFVELPTDFLYAIEEDCITSITTCTDNGLPTSGSTKKVKVRPMKHDAYTRNINNPFRKPYSNLVWRMDFSRLDADTTDDYYPKQHELITDGTYTITSYHARYVKRPRTIVVDRTAPYTNMVNCELDPSMFGAIIDEAVKIATGVTAPEGYQIKTIEKQQSE